MVKIMNNKSLRPAILFLSIGLVWTISTSTHAATHAMVVAGDRATTAPHAIRTDTVAVPGMQCGMCEQTISKKLRKIRGVRKVTADAEGKRVVVTYDANRVTRRSIERGIAAVGYDAGSERATEKAKAALPGCCRME